MEQEASNNSETDVHNSDIDVQSSDSDVSSTYQSDGELYTSIFHSEDSKSQDSKDFSLELYEAERSQLGDFNVITNCTANTIGLPGPVRLNKLEQFLSGDKFFIFTRPSIHRAIAECKGIPAPDGLIHITCVFSETKPVYILGVISNTRTPEENSKDSEYVACIARAITKKVRVEVVSNFDVICGILREDECVDEQKLRDKLTEFTKSTYRRTFDRSLEMDRERCVAAIRCFLAMVGIREDISQGRSLNTKDDAGDELDRREETIEPITLGPVFRVFSLLDTERNLGLRSQKDTVRQDPLWRYGHGQQSRETSNLSNNSDRPSRRHYRGASGEIPSPSLTDDDKLNGEHSRRTASEESRPSVHEASISYAPRWGPLTEPPWNEQEVDKLRHELLTKYRQQTKNNLKILLFGPTGQGKSSLGNSFLSGLEQDEKDVSHMFAVSRYTSSGSTTAAFNPVKILGGSYLIDMPGIFESNAITDTRIEDIASGKVPFYAELSSHLRVKGVHINPAPGKNDVACVVIVLSHDMDIGEEVRRQLDVIKKLAGKGVISYQLVLTHLDECDYQFRHYTKLPYLYKSEKVQKAVKRMSDEAGVPPYCISFVKNYVQETEKHPYATLLHLRVLKKIVSAACDQTVKKQDTASLKGHYHDSFLSKYGIVIAVGVAVMAVMVLLYFKL